MIKPRPISTVNPNQTGSTAHKFAVGARTYNGTAPSPHAGGLNPNGFQLREARANARRKMMMQHISKVRGVL